VTNPLVSIIICVYNGEEFLREAIDSAVAQEYEPTEIVVVDDGSTDASAAIAKSYPQVRYIYQKNQGPDAAKVAGMWAARGDYWASVDADDRMTPWALKVQMGYLLEHPEVTCVLGRQEWTNPPPWLTRDPVFGDLDGIPMSSTVVPLKIMKELGGYNAETGGDLDFLIRLRQAGFAIKVLDELVLYRRYHGKNHGATKQVNGPLPLISLKAKLDRDRARSLEAAET
jgi:glycosyltransferase involved in cell wall biosynthesis